MQIASRNERYLRAIDNSGLSEDLCRKLRILAGNPESLSGKTLNERYDSLSGIATSIQYNEERSWIEEQWMIERMQRAVGHM